MSNQDEMEKAIEKANGNGNTEAVVAGFHNGAGFDLMLRQAKWLSTSDLVPKEFKGNIANAVIALEMANRMNASPLAVMQNLYIVHGKPGWSAQFITAAINSTGKFSPLRFKVFGEGDKKTCIAWAIEHETGEQLEGPPVSIDMAKKEGWYGKNGSKWQTMPDLMLRYRAATFFGRLYAPEVLMGMKTMDEIHDTEPDFAERELRNANSGPVIDLEGMVKQEAEQQEVESAQEGTPPPVAAVQPTNGSAAEGPAF